MRTCELCGIKSSEYRNTSRGIWCKDCANECPGFSECKQIIRPSHDFAPYCKQCVAKCETCLEIITPYRNKKDYIEKEIHQSSFQKLEKKINKKFSKLKLEFYIIKLNQKILRVRSLR